MMEADILLFMGQSNMAGRGDDQLAPKVLPGAAWEYRTDWYRLQNHLE